MCCPPQSCNRQGASDSTGADAAICSTDILDGYRLSERTLHPLGNEPPEYIARATRGERYDHRDGVCWISDHRIVLLRACRQRPRSRTAEPDHELPLSHSLISYSWISSLSRSGRYVWP
jgi:hypothetical protein